MPYLYIIISYLFLLSEI